MNARRFVRTLLLLAVLGGASAAQITVEAGGSIIIEAGSSGAVGTIGTPTSDNSAEVAALRAEVEALRARLGMANITLSTAGLELHLDAKVNAAQHGAGNSATWSDLSGGGHTATTTGSIAYSSELGGGSYYLDGSSAHYAIDAWPAWNAAVEVTVEVWANVQSWPSINSGIFTNFLGGGGKMNWMFHREQKLHNNGFKGSYTSPGAPTYMYPAYNKNAWYRFALRYRADGTGFEFFVNNVRVGVQVASGPLAITPSGTSPKIGIGMREDDFERCNARVAIVRAYTRALSNAELRRHFQLEKARFGYDIDEDGSLVP